MTKYNFMKKHF